MLRADGGGDARLREDQQNLPICEIGLNGKRRRERFGFGNGEGRKKGGMVFSRGEDKNGKEGLGRNRGGQWPPKQEQKRPNDGVCWWEWRGKEGKGDPPPSAQCGSPSLFLFFACASFCSFCLPPPCVSASAFCFLPPLSPGEPPPDPWANQRLSGNKLVRPLSGRLEASLMPGGKNRPKKAYSAQPH